MVDLARAYRKANSFVAGWQHRYSATPPKHTVILGLCQPSAETVVGDAWRGPDGVLGTQDDTRNWGATTVRSCTPAELEAIAAAGITPSVGADHEARAKAAMAALAAAGLGFVAGTYRGVRVPRAEIHCDSKTILVNGRKTQVPYFVWFAAFDLDDDGLESASAEYYLSFVADPGNPARFVLLNPNATVYHLAAAVYARGYFAGFKPHSHYAEPGPDGILGTADDVDHDGNAENIQAYGAWLAPHFATWTAALRDWQPSEREHPIDEPVDRFDLLRPVDVQRALNALGCGRPLLGTDGNLGDLTTAAIGFYAGGTLASDGVTPLAVIPYEKGTKILAASVRQAMARDLRARGFEVIERQAADTEPAPAPGG